MNDDDLGHRHEAVGVVAVVAPAGQPGLPVRREQAERVPALGPPRVRHLTALEDHVVDRALGEAATHRQPGVAGPDDDRGDVASCSAGVRRRTQPTSTVTLVGLVMMSNTADRFCDWATSASMSLGEASASIVEAHA